MVMRGVFGGGLEVRAAEEGRACRVVVADMVGGVVCVVRMDDGDALKERGLLDKRGFVELMNLESSRLKFCIINVNKKKIERATDYSYPLSSKIEDTRVASIIYLFIPHLTSLPS